MFNRNTWKKERDFQNKKKKMYLLLHRRRATSHKKRPEKIQLPASIDFMLDPSIYDPQEIHFTPSLDSKRKVGFIRKMLTLIGLTLLIQATTTFASQLGVTAIETGRKKADSEDSEGPIFDTEVSPTVVRQPKKSGSSSTVHRIVKRLSAEAEKKLITLVNEKTEKDLGPESVVPGSHFMVNTEKNCHTLKEAIVSLVKTFPESRHILNTLNEPDFHILCTSGPRLSSFYKIDGSMAACFFSESNTMCFLTDEPTPSQSIIHHEFIHAQHRFLHQTPRCKNLISDQWTTPVHPVNAETVKIYNRALDKGDERIENFARLLQKKNQQKPLTEQENVLLKKYQQAIKNCLPPVTTDDSDPNTEICRTCIPTNFIENVCYPKDLPNYSSQKWGERYIDVIPPGSKEPLITGKFAIQRIWKSKINQQLHCHVSFVGKTQEDLVTLKMIKIIKIRTRFASEYPSIFIRLSERDAYTFQDLSEEAMETFYPEASQLRRQYINYCSGNENEAALSPREPRMVR